MNLSSFALRRGALIVLMLVLATSLAACSGSSDESEPADGGNGGATATVENGEVDISADDLAFDVSTIEATAGEGFTINFTNNESQPHNVAVYTEEGGEAIVQGEVITGPDATTQIGVEGLDAGTYYFQCDVHPEMNGTIVVSG
jgi:plastocyanin